jgi:ABC-2 type transport system ATP-binding protein
LELIGLRRRFGPVVALDGLNLTVSPAQVFGLLGPNGAGKTTAMRAILGIVALDSGQIKWKGRLVVPADRGRFGYLPEERGLYPSMQVLDHLVYLAMLHGLGRQEAKQQSLYWLERLGLASRAHDRVEQLSLGNSQRVQLIGALLHAPELLILDEPFSGLDPTGVDELSAILSELALLGVTVVFSSHQLDLVEGLCSQVAIVSQGKVVATGQVEQLTTVDPPTLVVGISPRNLELPPREDWFEGIPGLLSVARDAGRWRLVIAERRVAPLVLEAAERAGVVEHFAFERRRLSEVFRDAVGNPGAKEPLGAAP